MMIRSFHSISFHQSSYTPSQNRLRRNSCHCSHCSSSNIKQITLPNQLYEIHMHRKIRLANLLLNTLKPTDKYIRSKQKYKNIHIYSRNHQQLHSPINHPSPQQTSTPRSQDEIKDYPQNKKIPSMFSQYQHPKKSNTYFLNLLKTQLTRIDKNINQLIQTSRQQITEPDDLNITSKRTKQTIIKTMKNHPPYKSEYSIALNKRILPQKKKLIAPSNLLARTQLRLSKFAVHCIN
ncbi:unnamed protein product [Paramecium octaurelia]|uniref:Uncharacterized protein n=1 Tax=Paramecium octaurelia TaxID=43137 RepID=A0A8S1XMQ0_PAROT|nr:unnamed protein product [Paramecium octaurelia]